MHRFRPASLFLFLAAVLCRSFPGSLAASEVASEAKLELRGTIEGGDAQPPPLRVTLLSAKSPSLLTSQVGLSGTFHFRDLTPGTYELVVAREGLGEIRRSVVVSPSLADDHGTVRISVAYSSGDAAGEGSQIRVSAAAARIAGKVQDRYHDAQQKLAQGDAAGARKKLEQAVAEDPEYAAAWNLLGVIAFQAGDANRSEICYRRALDGDPRNFESLLNLGALLLRSGREAEALNFNRAAEAARPEDAAANAQLGATYLKLGNLDRAEHYLMEARRLDPAQALQPQLLLADIYTRRSEWSNAVLQLEELLRLRPDHPLRDKLQAHLASLKAAAR